MDTPKVLFSNNLSHFLTHQLVQNTLYMLYSDVILTRDLYFSKILKALTQIQQQVDSLLEVDIQSIELGNGVINSAFVKLFKVRTGQSGVTFVSHSIEYKNHASSEN